MAHTESRLHTLVRPAFSSTLVVVSFDIDKQSSLWDPGLNFTSASRALFSLGRGLLALPTYLPTLNPPPSLSQEEPWPGNKPFLSLQMEP